MEKLVCGKYHLTIVRPPVPGWDRILQGWWHQEKQGGVGGIE